MCANTTFQQIVKDARLCVHGTITMSTSPLAPAPRSGSEDFQGTPSFATLFSLHVPDCARDYAEPKDPGFVCVCERERGGGGQMTLNNAPGGGGLCRLTSRRYWPPLLLHNLLHPRRNQNLLRPRPRPCAFALRPRGQSMFRTGPCSLINQPLGFPLLRPAHNNVEWKSQR